MEKDLINFGHEPKLGVFVSTTIKEIVITSKLLICDEKRANAVRDMKMKILKEIGSKISELSNFSVETQESTVTGDTGFISEMIMSFPVENNEMSKIAAMCAVCRTLHRSVLMFAAGPIEFQENISDIVKAINEDVYD